MAAEAVFDDRRAQFFIVAVFEGSNFKIVGGFSASIGKGFDQHDAIARVIELTVEIGDCASEVIAVKRELQSLLSREKTTGAERRLAREPVIKLQTEAVIQHVKSTEAGHDKFARMGQVRSVLEHQNALLQSLPHHLQLAKIELGEGLLQGAHPPMREFGGSARATGSEISGVDQCGAQAAQLRVESTARSGRSRSDHANVEGARFDLMERIGAGLHVRVDYCEGLARVEGQKPGYKTELRVVIFTTETQRHRERQNQSMIREGSGCFLIFSVTLRLCGEQIEDLKGYWPLFEAGPSF